MTSEKFKTEDQDSKQEKHKIREQMKEILFLAQMTLDEQEDKKDMELDIRLGEMQSDDFIKRINEILDNDTLWSKLPENKDMSFNLHGVNYRRSFDKKSTIKQLRDLVEQHNHI